MESLLAHIEAGVGKEVPSFATAMVFDDEQIQKISNVMETLIEETAALSVHLVTSLGQVVDYKGSELKQIGEISSLLGGSFAALQQLGPTLNEQGVASNLIHRQGQHEDLYALSVGNDALLVLRFSVTPTTPRIGTVALYARRAVEELTKLMAASHQKATNPFGAEGAQALNTELDQLFGDANSEQATAPKSKLLSFTGALRKGLVTKSFMNRWDSAHPTDEKNIEQGEE
jgi:predicted regulator of Ras-like GTPase activity (Roadblock/LC7/MglB family)